MDTVLDTRSNLKLALKERLLTFLAKDQVLESNTDLLLYQTDATSLFSSRPAMVTLPSSADEVAAIVRAINEVNKKYDLDKDRFNFVARGAGTGLSGGAIGDSNSVIISLARLDRILDIDYKNQYALVEPGVVNAVLSHNCAEGHLHFAPDPSSQLACTIGGNIAENAGGIHCFKYGVTAEHILGLELIKPDGEVAYLGALSPTAPAPYKTGRVDLAKFFAGTEGTLGIVTKALLKLLPVPESFLTMQVCFASVDEAAQLIRKIIAGGFEPAAMELIESAAIEAVDSAYNLGFKEFGEKQEPIEAILLVEVDGEADEVQLESMKIKAIIDDFKPLIYRETQDPKIRTELWKVRKGVAAAFGQIAPYWYLYDAVVPRSKIPDALAAVAEIAEKYDLVQAGIAHAADGNIHPNFLYDPEKDPTVVERIFQASHEIMRVCVDLGGTLSGEHGIGVEKREYMPELFSENDLAVMKKVRSALDPNFISNPGKIFPVRICHE